MGTLKPTWLTFSDFTQLSSPHDIAGKKVLVVNIAGFLDFNTKFVADSFEKCGAECRISSINLPELERLRISPTEMRSTNIARVLENDKTLETLIRELAGKVSGFDSVALPAVFGLSSAAPVRKLKEALDIPVWLIPTMPPQVRVPITLPILFALKLQGNKSPSEAEYLLISNTFGPTSVASGIVPTFVDVRLMVRR